MPEVPPRLPLLLSTQALHEELAKASDGRDKLILCAVVQQSIFDTGHIPGSHLVIPRELVSGVKPAVGKLPDLEQLRGLLKRIGLLPDSHLIVYDDEGGGWAGRFIWTLDVLGHCRYSYVDGGLIAWQSEGRKLENTPNETPSESAASREYVDSLVVTDSGRASFDDVLASLDQPESIIWDARSAEEYSGTKNTAARNGHIPGAVNFDWLDTMDKENSLRLLPLPRIRSHLESLGIDSSMKVITHCQTHHRSGLTYLIGKLLGLDIHAYDGSWSEWGNHPSVPIESARNTD